MKEKNEYVKLLLQMIKESGEMHYLMGRLIGSMMCYRQDRDIKNLIKNIEDILARYEQHKTETEEN